MPDIVPSVLSWLGRAGGMAMLFIGALQTRIHIMKPRAAGEYNW